MQLEDMTATPPTRTILHTNQIDTTVGIAKISLDKAGALRALQVLYIEVLRGDFDIMHKDVAERVSSTYARHNKHNNRTTRLIQPN